jgi:DNA primase
MLSRIDFLSLVLPPLQTGECYCSWANDAQGDIKQKFVSSIEELSAESDKLVSNNFNSFFGLAKFASADQGRYATNAVSLKSFFLDVDCGEGKPYTDVDSGLMALKSFCKATNLPKPTIIKSGRGAHVYWILDKEIERTEWKPYAEQLLCFLYTNVFRQTN